MSRTPAKFTQADLARATRAAKQAGAAGIRLLPDGTIWIDLQPREKLPEPVEDELDIVL